MKKLPPDNIIHDIAIELGLEEAFVEKDCYAVEALKIIEIIKGEFNPIFSGGTSLSKGFDLIERFSEDLDFKVIPTSLESNSKSNRKRFRELLIDKLDTNPFKIDRDNIIVENESRFVKFEIEYPARFKPREVSLRKHLRIEIGFHDSLYLPEEKRNIFSFVDQVLGYKETFSIDCVSPIETAADKVSAFIWRVHTRDRNQPLGSPKNDPTIIRHLHDLYALKEKYLNYPDFKILVEKIYEKDKGRSKGVLKEHSLLKALTSTCRILKEDSLYEKEYEEFVAGMFYGANEGLISYTEALNAFENYIRMIQVK